MRRTIVAVALFVVGSVAFSQGMELGVRPTVSVPLADSSDLFRIGYGAELEGAARLTGAPLYFGGSVGYLLNPTFDPENSLSLISIGAGGGLSIAPSLLDIRLGINGGAYLGLYGEQVVYNPYASAGLSVGFGLGGGLALGLGADYTYYLTKQNDEIGALYQGISGAVTVSFAPSRAGGGSREPRIEVEPPVFQRVFPVFYRYYDDNAFGSLTIQNGERSDIENVELSFFVNGFMDAPKVVTVADSLDSGASLEVPLTALWSSEVLSLTESTNVAAQVQVSYRVNDISLSRSEAFNLRIENRNVITWADDRRAAAFVTTRDPSVLRFSRNVTNLVRDTGENALNEQLRKGLAILTAMDLYGFDYVTDSDTPYEQLSGQDDVLDYLQFPVQTLDYHAGDCDDLSILYAALLESVDVRAAFVTVPGHIYTAFALDISEEEARRTFARADDLIYREGEAWLPVEVTILDQGFIQAWAVGADQWKQAAANGTEGFFPIREAWEIYEPTGFTDDTFRPILPEGQVVRDRYQTELGRLVQRELDPIMRDLADRIANANPRSRPRLQNRLGTVYARYGRYDDARRFFLQASLDGYGNATYNLGNLAYLEGDAETALGFYQQALQELPADANVLISIAKAQFELQNYEEATRFYELGQAEDPGVASDFAYIIGEAGETGRASNAASRGNVLWGEETE